MFSLKTWLFLAVLTLLAIPGTHAADIGPSPTNTPPVDAAQAWHDAEFAIKKFRVAPGFKVELVAAEPQLANPVAFCFDERGRIFVSETYRYRTSALDIRHHMSWYEDDLASRTTQDRIQVIQKHLGTNAWKMGIESEQIRLLEDLNNDGRYEKSSVFAAGFTNWLDGIASGVLARRGELWFTDIPGLWHLQYSQGSVREISRKEVQTGFGVHFSLTGHDLHGLTWGPDGRIYFTIGDRGANLVTREGKRIELPDEGACFRMESDGSKLEVFATGLRNPQELAFNQLGDLFTGENDCDHGDRERWVQILKGSDSGWRIGYQFSEQKPGGAWMAERLWWTNFTGRAAYCLPPLAHIDNGPSGLAYYPGTGLSDAYQDTFLLCHFKGVDNLSGIRAIKAEPDGASYRVTSDKEFIWNCLPTDVDFSPDGHVYFSDWVHGWPKSERGRIYLMRMTNATDRAISEQVRKILRNGLERADQSTLIGHLSHPDMRIRLEAQFEIERRILDAGARTGEAHKLQARGRRLNEALLSTLKNSTNRLAKIHSLWAMRNVTRKGKANLVSLTAIASVDSDPEIRAQLARVLGEQGRIDGDFDVLLALCSDPSQRVRAFAAAGFAEIPSTSWSRRGTAARQLIELAAGPDGANPWMRHQLVMGWIGLNQPDAARVAREHASPQVRMMALLADRWTKNPEIAGFLSDPDPLIIVEAARAINDVPIQAAMPALARLLEETRLAALCSRTTPVSGSSGQVERMGPDERFSILTHPLTRRVLNAAFRSGNPTDARNLAAFAAGGSAGESQALSDLRAEAAQLLGEWSKPSPRDKVIGLWRPLQAREGSAATEAFATHAKTLLASTELNPEIRHAATRAAARLEFASAAGWVESTARDTSAPARLRIESMRALAALKAPSLAETLKVAAVDPTESIRREATRLSAKGGGGAAAPQLANILQKGSIAEKQSALAALATIEGTIADEIIYGTLRGLVEGNPPPQELVLDILEASAARSDARIVELLGKYKDQLPKNDPLAEYRPALAGGDPEAGRKVFFERAEASCLRCHRVGAEGGEVGPVLTDAGKRLSREHLLEAIVLPNARIAQGFESVLVSLKNGDLRAGIIKEETAAELVINSPEDGIIRVKKSDIKERQKAASGMPDGLAQVLSKSDLRDLVEFLARQK